MRKPFLIALGTGVFLIVVNIYLFYNLYSEQVDYQKTLLTKQAELCGSEIESMVQHFDSDLNFILFSDDILDLFKEDYQNSGSLRKLELFYSGYSGLINNIDIYDNNKNVLNLFKDKKNNYITDMYLAQRQRVLVSREQVKIHENEYQYFIPVFDSTTIYGNIVVSIDLTKYIVSELNKFHIDGISYQWVIDPESGKFSSNYPGNEIKISDLDLIIANLKNEQGDVITHQISSDSITTKVYTVYSILNTLDHRFGIAFSINSSYFVDRVFSRLTTISLISLAVFIFIVVYLLFQVARSEKKSKIATFEVKRLKNILELMPLGVVIFSSDGKIVYSNQVANDTLQIKSGEVEMANPIAQKLLFTGKHTKSISNSSAYDNNQFVLYQREGNEVILYKKDCTYFDNDKELIITTFLDITSLEKSRKYEAAANTAKSEFLAKMSHEIRTPMNGIIGMTDALNLNNLTKEQLEYVDIVKRSADLLLSLIDDILDYSKIEAGKMQLEEIPFRISEEVKLSLDLFRAIIEEKGIKLSVSIDEKVPDDIIGDPFRLRQVLSNLISNAVKFTHEGEIRLSLRVDETYNGNLTLLFEVADTGVGIPRERLESIFNSFTQADHSTSRKYGGSGLGTTIAKQLVNLMNGEIWVESPSGISKNKKYVGSKFSFTIEVFSNLELEKNIDYSEIVRFAEVKTFIITQNVSTKNRLTSYLKHLGMNAEALALNDEIIASIRKQLDKAGKYHLIIILDEPNFDGLWIARQLHNIGISDKHRILMISSNHKQENYIQSRIAGVDYYLIQPFEQNQLRKNLQRIFPSIEETEEMKGLILQKDIRILVAEDNLINQKVAESIFHNLGYKIDIAIDGKEVVDMVKKKPYDIVFMDLQMPEKDGVDATVEIRGLGFQMPIVAMTATSSKVGKDNAITSGMNDYVTKPIRVEAIRSVLQKWFT